MIANQRANLLQELSRLATEASSFKMKDFTKEDLGRIEKIFRDEEPSVSITTADSEEKESEILYSCYSI